MPKLILKRKAEVLREFSLPSSNSAFTVGSEPGNDVVVPDKLVSMTHFQCERQGAQFFVRDLKSAFGTYINGTKIGSIIEIHDGDIIQVGEHTLVFRDTPLNESNRDGGAAVGQSFSEFFSDVKAAVMQPRDGEPAKRPALAELPPTTMNTAQKKGQTAEAPALEQADEFDIKDLEEEISEMLGKDGGNRKATSAPLKTETYKKSPYYLLAIHGPYLGKKYQLNFGETKIGRDGKLNDIVIRQNKKGEVDPSISRRHATISYRDGKFFFSDKRSQSRSFVNQQKLSETGEVRLMPGDEIEIVSDQQSTFFRFVNDGHWDFSPPKRAGEWWLRYRTQAVNLATAVVVQCCIIFAVLAWRERAILTDVPDPFKVAARTFAKLNINGNLKIASPARDQDPVPAPVLAELNGDDEVDILITQASGVLLAINGKTGKPLWETTALVLNRACTPVAADLNGNGKADIVALTADGHLVAIDGLFGAEIWSSPFFEKELVGPPVVADFNGDRHPDVAAISVEGKLNVGYSQVFTMQWVDVDLGLACEAPLSAGDLDGDGDDEIMIGTERGIVLIYDGVERRVVTNFDMNEELNKLKGSFFEDNPIRHPIALADLNDDRAPDLIIASKTGNLLCVSLAQKSEPPTQKIRSLWWADLKSAAESAGTFSYPFALTHLDEDHTADIVVLNESGVVKAFRGRGAPGQRQPELWQTKPDSANWVSAPLSCDFNKDGVGDIVLVTEKRLLKILNGKNGEVLWRADQALPAFTSMPLLADLGDDTSLDIALLSSEATIYNFETSRRVPGGQIIWGQKFGTATNLSKLTDGGPTAGAYMLKLILNVIVLGAAVAGNIIFHQSRRRFLKA